jgi:hypothetical protein
MKLFIKVLIILVSFLFYNSNVRAQNIFDSGELIQVDSDRIEILESHLNTPYRMDFVLSEEFLAITDIDNVPALHIVKINSDGQFEYFRSIGREGRGPGEYINPSDIVSGLNDELFYVYDAGNRKIVPYNSNFEALTNEEISLQAQGMPVSLQKVGDNFLATGVNVGSKFFIVNNDGNVAIRVGEDISLGNNVPPNALALAWHSYSTVSTQQNKIAIFARSADFAEVFDLESLEKVDVFYNEDFRVPALRVEESGGSPRLMPTDRAKTTFLWVTSTEDKIFALYSGRSISHESDNYGDIVVVFDWELNVLNTFKLDHDSFSILATDDENLYSIQHYPAPAIRYVDLDF